MNDIFYSVACRKAGTSTRKPAALQTRYAKDTSVDGRLVTAVQRHSNLGYVTRKLRFQIPEGVNLEIDNEFTTTIAFGGGKKYADAAVTVMRSIDNFGRKCTHFQIAI